MRIHTLAGLLLTLFIYGCSGGGGGTTSGSTTSPPPSVDPPADSGSSGFIATGRVIDKLISIGTPTGVQGEASGVPGESASNCSFTAEYADASGAMLHYFFTSDDVTGEEYKLCMTLSVGNKVDLYQ